MSNLPTQNPVNTTESSSETKLPLLSKRRPVTIFRPSSQIISDDDDDFVFKLNNLSSSSETQPHSKNNPSIVKSKPVMAFKQGVCSGCSAVIMYNPSLEGSTIVQCYNCPHQTTFYNNATESVSSGTTGKKTLNSSENNKIDEQELEKEDFSGKEKFQGAMKGAMGRMKAMAESAKERAVVAKEKAVETKTKVANSSFVTSSREKAATAAHRTKDMAIKASEQTKVVALKAKEQTVQIAQKATSLIKNEEDLPSRANEQYVSPTATVGPLSSTSVFGVSIEEAVKRSAKIKPNIPDIVTKCIAYLYEKGIREEGIFRLSGSSLQIKELKDRFDKGEDVDLSQIRDEHIVTGLLKLYFRELPETILTFKALPEFKRAEGITDKHEQITQLCSAVSLLPECNKAVLQLLLKLLNKVVSLEDVNKMNVVNLAIVFSPTMACTMEIVKPLILYCDEIFNFDLVQL
jgi:hypothetical protein